MKPAQGFWMGVFVLLLILFIYVNRDIDPFTWFLISLTHNFLGCLAFGWYQNWADPHYEGVHKFVLLFLCPIWFIGLMLYRGIVWWNTMLNSLEKKEEENV